MGPKLLFDNASDLRCSEEDFMKLQVVWSNPIPLAKIKQTVQRIRTEQFGALYVVTNPDCTQEFELILGDAA
jgi:hypothetical protein